jgi:hypothetical protein
MHGLVMAIISRMTYLMRTDGALKKVIDDCKSKSGRNPSIVDVCSYIMYVAKWNTVMDGVLFSDSPNTEITRFNYRKRIQMVLYNLKCLVSFKLLKEEHC